MTPSKQDKYKTGEPPEEFNPVVQVAAVGIATAGGAGFSPIAPGTCGTAVAVPFTFLMAGFSLVPFAAVCVATILIGIWAASVSDRIWGTHDSGRIVIDEVAGYFVTMALVPRDDWLILIIGFFVFRAFDIIKPPPIRAIDEGLGGGTGVVLDDVAAGIMGCGVMVLVQRLGGFEALSSLFT